MQNIKGLRVSSCIQYEALETLAGQEGDRGRSGRKDDLDECTFNWVQQRLAV